MQIQPGTRIQKKYIDNLEKVQSRRSKLTNPPLSFISLEDKRSFIDLC